MAEDRRTVLKLITGVFGGGAAAAVCAPAIRALVAPIHVDTVRGADGFVPVLEVAALPEDGTPVAVPVVVEAPRDAWSRLPPTEVGAVFVRRADPAGTKVVAFSTVCPHLGCGVDYDRAGAVFKCPCHDSAFSIEGAVASGPSPRGLDELEVRVSGGRVEVRYQRFATGTKEKAAL